MIWPSLPRDPYDEDHSMNDTRTLNRRGGWERGSHRSVSTGGEKGKGKCRDEWRDEEQYDRWEKTFVFSQKYRLRINHSVGENPQDGKQNVLCFTDRPVHAFQRLPLSYPCPRLQNRSFKMHYRDQGKRGQFLPTFQEWNGGASSCSILVET